MRQESTLLSVLLVLPRLHNNPNISLIRFCQTGLELERRRESCSVHSVRPHHSLMAWWVEPQLIQSYEEDDR